jgi:hypothetical protein
MDEEKQQKMIKINELNIINDKGINEYVNEGQGDN